MNAGILAAEADYPRSVCHGELAGVSRGANVAIVVTLSERPMGICKWCAEKTFDGSGEAREHLASNQERATETSNRRWYLKLKQFS